MTTICKQAYEYDSIHTCARVLPHHPDEQHEAADGFRWTSHWETYAEGTDDEGVETWDSDGWED